jgi:P27 family predicted phage terminase small subunit
MPGVKGASGRPGKPTDQHLQDGTYRKHRHANRVDNKVQPAPMPVPGNLGEHAAEMWKRIVGALPPEVLTNLDKDALMLYCQTWQTYCKIQPLFDADPVDKELRIAWTSCVDRLDKLGRQFGWTPQSRATLQMPAKDEDAEDPMTLFLKRRAQRN